MYSLERGLSPMQHIFVPVSDSQGKPLMPTTPARGRRWIKSGKATAFWKGGLFGVRLNVEPTSSRTPKSPPFQNAVAFPLLIQRRARAGVVGINGFPWASLTGTNRCCMGDKPLSSEYIPFAADRRRGDRLGRCLSRPLGCPAQGIHVPSDALLPELGQASLAVTLERFPLARAVRSQAPAVYAGVLDCLLLCLF